MTNSKLKIGLLLSGFLLISALTISVSSNDTLLDLSKLDGNWIGAGTYQVPFTSMTANIDGKAEFVFDTTKGYLRTILSADNMLFGYSDSGHLQITAGGDSAVWEIWNNWGYHLKYPAIVDGNMIHGTRKKGTVTYDVYLEIVNSDSISGRLVLTNEKGESKEEASCYLKRKTKK